MYVSCHHQVGVEQQQKLLSQATCWAPSSTESVGWSKHCLENMQTVLFRKTSVNLQRPTHSDVLKQTKKQKHPGSAIMLNCSTQGRRGQPCPETEQMPVCEARKI